MSHPVHASAAASPLPPDAVGVRRWWALALICLAQFMLILDMTVVNVALPTIDADLRLGDAIGWTIAAYTLPFGMLLVAGGLLADRIGLKVAFLVGLAVFTLASAGAAAATAPEMLIVFRGGQGVGAALLSPAALGLVLSLFSGAARIRALAVWAGIGGAGAAVGAVLGGVLTGVGGWRWVFLVNVPVGVAVGILVLLVVRGSMLTRPAEGERHRGVGTAMRVLRSRTVGGGVVTMLLASMMLIGSFFALTITLQDAAGFGPLAAGLAFLPAAVAVALGAQVGAHLLGHVPARVIGAAAFAVVATGFAIAWLSPGSAAAAVTGVAVAALGLGPVLVTATATATSQVPPEESGTVSGVVNTVHEVGGGIGVLAASLPVLVAATASGSSLVFGLAAGAALIAGLVALKALPRGRVTAAGGMHH